jgi:hypothetical protein
MFADDMMLQRDVPCPIWGWTKTGQQVTVTMGDQTVRSEADAEDKWLVHVGPIPPGIPVGALTRELQAFVARNVPNSGLAVSIDRGEIFDIHPPNKCDVGNRLGAGPTGFAIAGADSWFYWANAILDGQDV